MRGFKVNMEPPRGSNFMEEPRNILGGCICIFFEDILSTLAELELLTIRHSHGMLSSRRLVVLVRKGFVKLQVDKTGVRKSRGSCLVKLGVVLHSRHTKFEGGGGKRVALRGYF